VSSSASIISNQSRNTTSPNSLLFSSSQEQDNDERIQLIVDDINHIVEKYTRELDDALRTKPTIRSSSSCQNNNIDILYQTNKEQQKLNPPPLPPKRQIGNFYLSIEHNRKYNCAKKKETGSGRRNPVKRL
jgi:hypothetical protein